MTATIIIRANVTEMAKKEYATEDNIIETLTNDFTDRAAEYGVNVWVENVLTEGD